MEKKILLILWPQSVPHCSFFYSQVSKQRRGWRLSKTQLADMIRGLFSVSKPVDFTTSQRQQHSQPSILTGANQISIMCISYSCLGIDMYVCTTCEHVCVTWGKSEGLLATRSHPSRAASHIVADMQEHILQHTAASARISSCFAYGCVGLGNQQAGVSLQPPILLL